MKKFIVLSSAVALMFSLSSYAEEPEFFIKFTSCKSAIGYLVLSNESLKIIEGIPLTMGCFRKGENISCSFVFHNGQKGYRGNAGNYKIVIDSPPLLYFETLNGSEFIAIDTSQHAAVLVSKILSKEFAGSKVCQGLYATSFEIKSLEKLY